jgi:hypothetical protein
MPAEKALVIVPRRGDDYREDFATIAAEIMARDPSVTVRVAHEEADNAPIAAALTGLPALIVGFDGTLALPVLPGRRFICRQIIKTAQLRQYAEAGIAHPVSAVFQWGQALDARRWGPLTVLKPLDPGATSKGLAHLVPTQMVGKLQPQHFAPEHPIHASPMLVQSFIDTGPYPSHFRVLLLFGEPLYMVEHVMSDPRPPLDAPPQVLLGASIATNGGVRERRLVQDPGIIAFAQRMAGALPAIPLQGIDIMREHGSGRLIAIENNPGGNTWHFSSPLGEELRQQIPRAALLAQFGGLTRAAEILLKATQLYARA